MRGGQGVKFLTAIVEWAHRGDVLIPNSGREYSLYPQFPQLREVQLFDFVPVYSKYKPHEHRYRFEVFGVEDVQTPAGVFKDCVKVMLHEELVDLGIVEVREFLWLAPDVGPVMFVPQPGISYYKLSEYKVQ